MGEACTVASRLDSPGAEPGPAGPPRVHVITYGCQMNAFDSRRVVQVLARAGYVETADPAMADVILVNTCSVRDAPEKKVLGTLSRLLPLKQMRPGLVFGVCGCVAQQHGSALLDRVPYLDFVFGTDAVGRAAEVVEAARAGERVASTARMSRAGYEFVDVDPAVEPGPTAFLTIMKGCDKACSYCIVPFVRGREVGKPLDRVLDEVRRLVAGGVREVTLLGQNVNAWGADRPGGPGFADLLDAVDAVPGLSRLRFVTSHPADADARMLSRFGRLRTLAEYLHLPVQSGSDSVLRRMRRGYTAAEYLDKVAMLRSSCPDAALSTDIIVGFPGETAADFDATMRLVEAARFDAMFSFKYSPRPHTAAFRLADDVAEVEKARRLAEVQALQDRIGAERMALLLGRDVEVLVEGPSRDARTRGAGLEWMGRTRTNLVANFRARPPASPSVGSLLRVRVAEVLPHCLRCEVVGGAPAAG